MKCSIGAWLALRHGLNPGVIAALLLTTALPGLTAAAWGTPDAAPDSPAPAGALSEPLSATELPATTARSDDQAAGLPRPWIAEWSPAQGGGWQGSKPEATKTASALRRIPDEGDRTLAEAIAPDPEGSALGDRPAAPEPEQSITQPPDPEAVLAPAERSEVFVQAAYLQQGDAGSARLRAGGIYVLSPSVFAGATVDLSTGKAFSDTDQTGLSLSELYLTASPANLSELRFTVGLMDLTSYLDRNSFAKDSLTHFFNPVFQTNPALSAVNVASRPGALVNWTPVDALSLTATAFSSSRDLGSFALDSFAGEVGVRFGNAIVRGTYVTSTDAGRRDGFSEIFSLERGNGQFGPLPGDRETGFGLNAEAFIPNLKLGFFGRYGWYTNQTLGASGQTYSLGVNGLDVLMPGDRLGLGYGRQLSNSDLRQASGGPTPDVWELFYDTQIIDNLRAGVSVQQRNAFSETYLGFRVRYDLMWNPLRRAAE
ncbi:hypothetical protein PGN35_007165 [Nodosilinea sp. PGN35]|uniref:hypothetical protein n=1 Tax=Nodosilinea sp. PGN35 TaxID=3020489 RepID=UPI0023B27C26|nr:hypothetical protein [Nodosilinea sp. TSF1-S3]MDF0365917.1 hypothetical protein [Nodosilinea sp. TSF1-S3]